MTDLSNAQTELLRVAEGLLRYRFDLTRLVFELESFQEDQADATAKPEAELRSDLECALMDHLDPLLRTILGAAGGARGKLLEVALDLGRLKNRLQAFCEALPHSPQEDAMLDGEIPSDVPTEMRTTVGAIIEDQLNLALENLLHAIGYIAPPAPVASVNIEVAQRRLLVSDTAEHGSGEKA
jgi:hypothetical protein